MKNVVVWIKFKKAIDITDYEFLMLSLDAVKDKAWLGTVSYNKSRTKIYGLSIYAESIVDYRPFLMDFILISYVLGIKSIDFSTEQY